MTPDAISPPYVLVIVLLLVSGVMKVLRPRATAQAMLTAGLPGDGRGRPIGVGVVEIVVAGLGRAGARRGGRRRPRGGLPCFAAFLAYVLRTHPDAGSCGCAGATAVPPSRLHLSLDLLAAASRSAYASTGDPARRLAHRAGTRAIPIRAGLAWRAGSTVVAVTRGARRLARVGSAVGWAAT